MTKINTNATLTNSSILAILRANPDVDLYISQVTAEVKILVVNTDVKFGIVVTPADFDGQTPVEGHYRLDMHGVLHYMHDLVQEGALERAHFAEQINPRESLLAAAAARYGSFAEDMCERDRSPNPPSSRHEVITSATGHSYPRIRQQWRH